MVAYRDGSVIAQMGVPDMRTCISYALFDTQHMQGVSQFPDFAKIAKLTFASPDEKTFTLTDDSDNEFVLTLSEDLNICYEDELFHRCESPSSLISSVEYETFFDKWYEESNLLGNSLTISEPDSWVYQNPKGEEIASGSFCAYADEPEYLYLYFAKDGAFYARFAPNEKGEFILEKHLHDHVILTCFASHLNSTERQIYFVDKGIEFNYLLDSGMKLLRNGGAVYNDDHDYKKAPVSCSISVNEDKLLDADTRYLEVEVYYQFKRDDLPALSGSQAKIYNSVLFSQYDYYTGELFYMEDSTGNEEMRFSWRPEFEYKISPIDCVFESTWEYPKSDVIFVEWKGTYRLTMPKDYDGFVICLRPVFNSYSAQVSSPSTPEKGTLFMEDIGDDLDKTIICRIPGYCGTSKSN